MFSRFGKTTGVSGVQDHKLLVQKF